MNESPTVVFKLYSKKNVRSPEMIQQQPQEQQGSWMGNNPIIDSEDQPHIFKV